MLYSLKISFSEHDLISLEKNLPDQQLVNEHSILQKPDNSSQSTGIRHNLILAS